MQGAVPVLFGEMFEYVFVFIKKTCYYTDSVKLGSADSPNSNGFYEAQKCIL